MPGVFDGPLDEIVTLLARAWQLFGKVTAAVDCDAVVRERGEEPALPEQERIRRVPAGSPAILPAFQVREAAWHDER